MEDLMYLKSGTDIRGTAIEKNGKPVDLTDERLESIVNSLVVFLKNLLDIFGFERHFNSIVVVCLNFAGIAFVYHFLELGVD